MGCEEELDDDCESYEGRDTCICLDGKPIMTFDTCDLYCGVCERPWDNRVFREEQCDYTKPPHLTDCACPKQKCSDIVESGSFGEEGDNIRVIIILDETGSMWSDREI